MWRILYLIFIAPILMLLCYWSNTVLSQMAHYTGFHIFSCFKVDHYFNSNFIVIIDHFIIFAGDIILIQVYFLWRINYKRNVCLIW